jgi:hypothetical protein
MTKTKHKFAFGDRVRLLPDGNPIVNPLDIYAISRQPPFHARVSQNRVQREGDEQERVLDEDQLMMPEPPREHASYEQMQARQRQRQRTRNADALARARSVARHTESR